MSAFMMFAYFLLDTVDRKKLIDANNALIEKCDELWVFGDISEGVKLEIDFAKKLGRKIRYFAVDRMPETVGEIMESQIKYE